MSCEQPTSTRQRCYFTLTQGHTKVGRLKIILYNDIVPKTCRNFSELIVRGRYQDTKFHRIIAGFMAQGGDYEHGDGTGGASIYGAKFADENFNMKHFGRGVLSMANAGRDTNGSQFFICFRAIPHLDGKHVVFGVVDMSDKESSHVLDLLESVQTNHKNDCPFVDIVVSDCGIEMPESDDQVISCTKSSPNDSAKEDHDEIDLNDANENSVDDTVNVAKEQISPEESEEVDAKPPENMNPLQRRLFALKMKMNQSRRLNRVEVLAEGSRLGSEEGMMSEKKRMKDLERKSRKADWQELNQKIGGDSTNKHLFESATLSQTKARRKEDRAVANRFEITDFYNPEGQHRNYQRDLKSLPRGVTVPKTNEIYDPLTNNNNDLNATNSEGARRLAEELQARADKAKKRNVEIEGDVDYINKRNKRFNQKIERNYGKYTAEIKQNLERGTAL